MNFLVLIMTFFIALFPLSVCADDGVVEEGNALELLKGIKINGMLDTYYSYNFNRPPDRTDINNANGNDTNRFRAFDKEDNSITVDNFELVISKPVSKSSRAGFTLITNYGEIAQRIVFAKHANYGRADDDDFTISTAYVHYLADVGDGLDLKVGRFPTWIGAEVWESVDNPNWSRSLLYQNAIPFTHTGVSAEYGLSDDFTVAAYLVNGWDSFEENNNSKSVGYRLAFEREAVSFYINAIHGDEKDDLNTSTDGRHDTRNLWDFILDLNPTDKLHLNINYDTGTEQNTGHWQGVAAVVDYDFTDDFNLALRGEYFKDAGVQNAAGVFQTRTGVQQGRLELYELTLTANFRVSDKIMVRPEYRRDWSKDRVFDSNSEYGQDTLACSVAYVF